MLQGVLPAPDTPAPTPRRCEVNTRVRNYDAPNDWQEESWARNRNPKGRPLTLRILWKEYIRIFLEDRQSTDEDVLEIRHWFR